MKILRNINEIMMLRNKIYYECHKMMNLKLVVYALVFCLLTGGGSEVTHPSGCHDITNFPISTPNEDGYLIDEIPGTNFVCCLCPAGTWMSKICLKADTTSRLCELCVFVDGNPSQQYFVDENPHPHQNCKLSLQVCPPGFIRQQGNRTHNARCKQIPPPTTAKKTPPTILITTTVGEPSAESATNGLSGGWIAFIVVLVVIATAGVAYIWHRRRVGKPSLSCKTDANSEKQNLSENNGNTEPSSDSKVQPPLKSEVSSGRANTEVAPVRNHLVNEQLRIEEQLNNVKNGTNVQANKRDKKHLTLTEDARRETQCADDVTESLDNIVTGLGGETANQSSVSTYNQKNKPMSSSPSFVKQVHDEKTESHQTTENLSLHKLSDTYVISQPSKNSPHEVTQNILKVKKASPSTNHQSLQGDSGKYANAAISNEVLCNEVNVHPDESLPLLPQHSRGDGGNISRRVDTPRKIHDVATYRKIMIGIRDELRSYVQVSLINETLRYLGFLDSEIEDINFNQSGDNRTREITVKGFEMMIRRGEQNVNPSKLIKAFRTAGNNECAEVVKEYCSKNNFPCDDG